MKVLICNLFISYTSKTLEKYLKRLGHSCVVKNYYTPEDLYEDFRIDSMLGKDIKLIKPDLVLTVNFWPPVARACHKAQTKYISYGYDSPQNLPALTDMEYETNFIFFFDRQETLEYRDKGIDRAFHSPLATDVNHWDSFGTFATEYDISLVGNLYESTFPSLYALANEYEKGYLKALVLAQQKLYGSYLIPEVLKGRVNSIPASEAQLSYSIGTYITHLDRLSLLKILGQAGDVHLFSGEISPEIKEKLGAVNLHKSVDYLSEMPLVFKKTAINLNPILRVIRSGVPQRALDVMGCGGFLLSSFQPELFEYFALDEEVVMYDSYEDALAKADFYIRNESLRKKVTVNGYEKVKAFFGYETRIQDMLKIAGCPG